jgi:hypothetical protein
LLPERDAIHQKFKNIISEKQALSYGSLNEKKTNVGKLFLYFSSIFD